MAVLLPVPVPVQQQLLLLAAVAAVLLVAVESLAVVPHAHILVKKSNVVQGLAPQDER